MLLGLDIGGTKLAAHAGREQDGELCILRSAQCPTPRGPQEGLAALERLAREALDGETPRLAGISCGGPLDEARGVVLSPPNLPGWDEVPVCSWASRFFSCPAALRNDANACALAEWRFGAGRGTRHMIFLTFGTGMGAGLVLNGALYSGANGNAGEVGHARLSEFGPVGYGKAGSFEGYCSGGGIAQLGRAYALEQMQQGQPPSYAQGGLEAVTALSLARAAREGDQVALSVWKTVGDKLGRALALMVDMLNPERIVLGSIYERSGALMRDAMLAALAREALPAALAACDIRPAQLGERIGAYAALCAALEAQG